MLQAYCSLLYVSMSLVFSVIRFSLYAAFNGVQYTLFRYATKKSTNVTLSYNNSNIIQSARFIHTHRTLHLIRTSDTVRLHTKRSKTHQHSVTLLTSCGTPLELTQPPWYREVVSIVSSSRSVSEQIYLSYYFRGTNDTRDVLNWIFIQTIEKKKKSTCSD